MKLIIEHRLFQLNHELSWRINLKTSLFIEKSLEDLEKDMISAFNSGINADGIKENIDLIAKASLVDSSDLSKQITDYLYYACGPISKLEVVFKEEIIFHEIISNKRYRFMDSDYESSYKDVVKQFNETYYSMRDSLLNHLVGTWRSS